MVEGCCAKRVASALGPGMRSDETDEIDETERYIRYINMFDEPTVTVSKFQYVVANPCQIRKPWPRRP